MNTTGMTTEAPADSVAKMSLPELWENHSHEADAPTSPADMATATTVYTRFTDGLAGDLLPRRPGYDSGVLTMIIASFLLVAFSFRNASRLWKTFFQDLIVVRRRANLFDERTVGEKWVIAAMLMQTCIYEGLMLFAMISVRGQWTPQGSVFPMIAALTGLAALLYLFQSAACFMVGYAFTDQAGRLQWLRGLNASQSVTGFALVIPALGALFHPDAAEFLLFCGGLLYILGRFVFIYKGFRIFYHGITSLLYFILYLCALEIIPVIMVCTGALSLCQRIN